LIFLTSFLSLTGHLSLSEISHLDIHIRVSHPDSKYNKVDILHIDSGSRNHEGTTTSPEYKHDASPPGCMLKFPAKCRTSPFVKYWDDSTPCFSSPLRCTSGLSQPRDRRRFVTFQPDLGGWNNIRMALEVVLLFAKVYTTV
jgi:hypothetical protein